MIMPLLALLSKRCQGRDKDRDMQRFPADRLTSTSSSVRDSVEPLGWQPRSANCFSCGSIRDMELLNGRCAVKSALYC